MSKVHAWRTFWRLGHIDVLCGVGIASIQLGKPRPLSLRTSAHPPNFTLAADRLHWRRYRTQIQVRLAIQAHKYRPMTSPSLILSVQHFMLLVTGGVRVAPLPGRGPMTRRPSLSCAPSGNYIVGHGCNERCSYCHPCDGTPEARVYLLLLRAVCAMRSAECKVSDFSPRSAAQQFP